MTTKAHKPTQQSQAKVRALALAGVTKNEIASIIGVSYKTLQKHYTEELIGVAAAATANIAQKLYKQANEGDTKAAMFWLKEQAKKTESKVELPDTDDVLEFFTAIWKNNDLDIELRMQAARSMLPYVHGKVAEKGKKETKADEAKDAAKSGGKFGTLNSQIPRPS